MILDKPIKTKEEDLLGHEPLAIRIAEAITNLPPDALSESFVVGIEGNWGSGKTSLINLVMKNLEPSSFPVVRFNPWNFSNQDELIADFFNSIAEELEQTPGGKNERIAESIRSYFPKLLKESSIDISPEISFAGFKLNFGSVYKTGGDTLEARKEKINGLLRNFPKPIVIVIDDIDRLESQETRLVFRLVKMMANFPNTVFLLAYDRGRVGGMLKDEGVPGEEFLKKIVQLSFPLPRVDQRDLFEILFRELRKIIAGFGTDAWDQHRWEYLFESGLKSLFPTVRDIKRYVNSVRLDLEVIGKEEVNPVDFLGIEAIRVFAPEVYFSMAREKSTFAFPATDGIYHIVEPLPPPGGWIDHDVAQDKSKRKAIFEKIIEKKSPEGFSDAIKQIIRKLFPQVEDLYSDRDRKHGDQELNDWRQQLRVCSEDLFDKYFSLSIVYSVFSEKDLRDFLAKIDDRPASMEKLKKFHKESNLNLLLRRLIGNLDKLDLSVRELEDLLIAVFDFMENMIAAGFPDAPGLDYQAVDLGLEMTETITKEKRIESLKRVLDSTKDVYMSTWLIDKITREAIEYEQANEYEKIRFPNGTLLTREEVSGLNKICAEKIKKAAENGYLENEKRLDFLLSRWKEWGSEQEAKEYAAKLSETKDGLFSLLKAYHHGGVIHKESIGEFVSVEKVDERVNLFDVSCLSEDKAEIIRLWKQ